MNLGINTLSGMTHLWDPHCDCMFEPKPLQHGFKLLITCAVMETDCEVALQLFGI
jgi:hypothetical protein